ncbi:Uncharacterised protein [Vibrio cholerae]|nr:Uncharacterised protein [Vibrio cholerae]CSA34465.1 Uncharacterised protein [Vibrio cholerae]CSB47071.1 Uncharacterised protein [Vibrio cholerae]CSC50133.1 Uncharacterised protein [Vibrio cholerae]
MQSPSLRLTIVVFKSVRCFTLTLIMFPMRSTLLNKLLQLGMRLMPKCVRVNWMRWRICLNCICLSWWPCVTKKQAKPFTTALMKCVKRSISVVITPNKSMCWASSVSKALMDQHVVLAVKVVVYLCVSARGTSRWRFSLAKSVLPWWPEIP